MNIYIYINGECYVLLKGICIYYKNKKPACLEVIIIKEDQIYIYMHIFF